MQFKKMLSEFEDNRPVFDEFRLHKNIHWWRTCFSDKKHNFENLPKIESEESKQNALYPKIKNIVMLNPVVTGSRKEKLEIWNAKITFNHFLASQQSVLVFGAL